MNNELIKRLKAVMDTKEISAAELSRLSGIRASSISDYLNAKYEPKQDKIDLMARALNVSPAWLMGYNTEQSTSRHAKGVRIPVLGRVAAGIPIEAITDIDEWEEISGAMAKTGEYFALKITGNSMEPRMLDGDVVIVKRQSDVDNGDVAVVLVNGNDATVKQITKSETGLTLIGWNLAAYTPRTYNKKECRELPVSILGKVVEIRGKL
nr:MAG TPA: Repressor protein CI [Caudoviricetes sp.]